MNNALLAHFETLGESIPEVIDLRGMEPPEPMQRILLATTGMPSGEKYLAHLPHIPYPLFPNLEARELHWKIFEQDDGSALVLIWKDQ